MLDDTSAAGCILQDGIWSAGATIEHQCLEPAPTVSSIAGAGGGHLLELWMQHVPGGVLM